MTVQEVVADRAARRARRSREAHEGRSRILVWTARLAIIVVFLGIWELGTASGTFNSLLFSRPSEVWTFLVDYAQSGTLLHQTLATLQAVGLALLIGIPLGILAGLVLAASPVIEDVIGPFLVPINSTPRIALVPVFIIWFGLTTTTKVAVAVSIIFFMVMFNARAGVKNIEPDMLMVSRSLGLSRREVFQKVVLPGSVPTIFAGVRLAVTYSILGVVATEMIAARRGLGLDIVKFANTLRIGGVFAILLVLILLATVAARILDRVERRLLRWQ